MDDDIRDGSREDGYDLFSFIGTTSVGTGGASAVITKLLSALACHGGAAVVPFHPKVALWTLLELGSLHELYEVLIVLVESVADLVLSTAHA